MRRGWRHVFGALTITAQLAACAQPPGGASGASGPPPLPLSMLRDRTESNAAAIAAFASSDPGWRIWLEAFGATAGAAALLANQSMQDVQTIALSEAIAFARDRYRVATGFYLRPIMVKSSCLDLPGETNGAVALPSGLVLRYRLLSTAWVQFPNGSSCRQATGYVSEVDSPGGLAMATVSDQSSIDWQSNFALALGWNAPFEQIAREDSLSLANLMALARR
ncbi:hypothetical protein [Acidisoma sp. C75]